MLRHPDAAEVEVARRAVVAWLAAHRCEPADPEVARRLVQRAVEDAWDLRAWGGRTWWIDRAWRGVLAHVVRGAPDGRRWRRASRTARGRRPAFERAVLLRVNRCKADDTAPVGLIVAEGLLGLFDEVLAGLRVSRELALSLAEVLCRWGLWAPVDVVREILGSALALSREQQLEPAEAMAQALLADQRVDERMSRTAQRVHPSDPDEVVQEVRLRLWQRLPGDAFVARDPERGFSQLLGWVDATTRGRAANLREAGQREVRLPESAGRELVDDAERRLDAHHRIARLHALLEDLMPEQQRLVRLCLVEQRSHAEVAALLGLRPNTVAVRLHRLRKRLRCELDAQEQS